MTRPILVLALFAATVTAFAQSDKTGAEDEQRKQAAVLWERGRMAEAYPIYQWLSMRYPNDTLITERLGFTMLVAAQTETDPAKQKEMRAQAKKILKRAQELGDKSDLVHTADNIPDDGSRVPYSSREDVDRAMRVAEMSFAKGDYDDAISGYLEVIQLDSQNYQAPLFLGDVLFKQKKYDAAADWFKKAIAINPNLETAHRYWGDALRFAGKTDEAREKFIDAVVAEPYNRQSWVGISQWARENHFRLVKPVVHLPAPEIKDDKNINITISPGPDKGDGSTEGELAYSMNRALWHGEKFKKTFPGEAKYRHTLTEEVDSLTLVTSVLSETKKRKKPLREDLQQLVEIKSAGLLEPFVLFTLADNDIARDYEAYRDQHREQLKKFVLTYMLAEEK
jgi:tetratricopeptide (TPR) repeat protein